jgi:stringent starvation protein B
MTQVSTTEIPGSSTRPYLIRALHDWCTDNGFTPYLAVHVDRSVQVPMEYVKNNEIVLNVGFEATSGLKLGNDFIEFRARFGGQGMAFPMPTGESEAGAGAAGPVSHSTAPGPDIPRGLRLAPATPPAADEVADDASTADDDEPPESPTPAPSGTRPALKRIK